MDNIIAIKTAEGEFIGEEPSQTKAKFIVLENCYKLNIVENMRGVLTVAFRPAVHPDLVDLNENESMSLQLCMGSFIYAYKPSTDIIKLYKQKLEGNPTHKIGPSGLQL